MTQVQIPRWALAAAAVFVVFMIGFSIHSAGWSQGFVMGLLVGSGDGGAVAPHVAYGMGGWHHGGIGGFFGGIVRFMFLLFFIALMAKFFGFLRWHRHHHHNGGWQHSAWGQGPWGQGPWGQHSQGERPWQQGPQSGPQQTQPLENERAAGDVGHSGEQKPQKSSLTYV